MAFSSLPFFLLLSLAFGWHWLMRGRRARLAGLAIASSIFYAWWDWRFLGFFVATTLLTYALGHVIASADDRRRRWLLVLALLLQFAPLAFFKYANFAAATVAALVGRQSFPWLDGPLHGLVLPLGISFVTFQAAAYLIDVASGAATPARSFLEFHVFIAFFPKLAAGPIERSEHLLPQLQQFAEFDPVTARAGAREILWGLFKKAAIADPLGRLIVDPLFSALDHRDAGLIALATLAFAVQIYADFSAYSNIARGAGRLLGIELVRNFREPYFTTSFRDFWQRWHISLSSWFRDYVYVPLHFVGPWRASAFRAALNLLVTFLLTGLWHGANWTFVAWGALHGVAMIVEGWLVRPTSTSTAKRVLAPLRGAVFASVLLVGWLLFRSASLGEFGRALSKLPRLVVASPAQWAEVKRFASAGTVYPLWPTVIALGILIAFEIGVVAGVTTLTRAPRPLRWAAYTVLVLLTTLQLQVGTSPFVYVRF